MSDRLSITKYGDRYWAVWLDGQLLAVTLYRRGPRPLPPRDYEPHHAFWKGGPSCHPSCVIVPANRPFLLP